MPLPTLLIERIQVALSAMRMHPEHALAPVYRKKIYDAFVSLERPSARAWLALTTANFVRPIWQSGRPFDPLVSEVLELARSLLQDVSQISIAEAKAGAAWERLEKLGYTRTNDPKKIKAWFAGEAAVSALHAALGRDPFIDIEISDQDTDDYLDPWGSDTAKWASIAYSGRVGDPQSDAQERLAFWTWWLDEAIPRSWDASSSVQVSRS